MELFMEKMPPPSNSFRLWLRRGGFVEEKIIPRQLVGFRSVKDMERLEQYCNDGFTDAGMTEIRESNIPSVDECDEVIYEIIW
ncbi:hypothetical protein J32TS6_04830 [Virgibacillus pantothenticus]|uniref:hypothetical protein n=1 Tax=Virgibacillus pantothenticus TaxID=1473 RepID=UPI001B19CE13|nr:hypothetical protein [Virgibacillus pantothenticus]GIP61928.1 hypothetical protein J32TS6_04830 [Virgibacillus pantothenticus]